MISSDHDPQKMNLPKFNGESHVHQMRTRNRKPKNAWETLPSVFDSHKFI